MGAASAPTPPLAKGGPSWGSPGTDTGSPPLPSIPAGLRLQPLLTGDCASKLGCGQSSCLPCHLRAPALQKPWESSKKRVEAGAQMDQIHRSTSLSLPFLCKQACASLPRSQQWELPFS